MHIMMLQQVLSPGCKSLTRFHLEVGNPILDGSAPGVWASRARRVKLISEHKTGGDIEQVLA